MGHVEIAGEGIVTAKLSFLCTKMTANLLLICVVDGILVSREIIRSRKDGIAGLSCGGIKAVALVRSML